MFNKLLTLRRFLSGKDFYGLSLVNIFKIFNYVHVHKIEPWHLTQLASAQSYQKEVINFVNSLGYDPNIVDIGCGLGLISRRIKFKTYIGYDQSLKVINLANILNKKPCVTFNHNAAHEISKFNIEKNSIILSLNFLHSLTLRDVNFYFEQVLLKCQSGILVFDIPNNIYSLDDLFSPNHLKMIEIINRKKNVQYGRELIILRF